MNKTTLIIEDDDLLREIYATKLELEGFMVITAADGAEGLEKAMVHEPQIILLDMIMPRMNGLEFLETFRPLDVQPPVTTLVMSNKSSGSEMIRAKMLGARDYIIKAQHTPDDIVAMIRTYI